ncbi:Endopolyphosphatase [Borealophlyctis nickersoniae]|nr:Endopolyphosphatase [Borealophlyctis nickersoniae]
MNIIVILALLGYARALAWHQRTPNHHNRPHNAIGGSERAKPWGKFLHITDLHIDPYYQEGSPVYSSCHPESPEKLQLQGQAQDIAYPYGRDRVAGRFGATGGECDSPLILINETFRFVTEVLDGQPAGIWDARELGKRIVHEGERERGLDFVIWTGDSARHDSDPRIKRTGPEIQALNHMAVEIMLRAFSSSDGRPSIPIVPTIGNNDIWPHNNLYYTPETPNPTLDFYNALWSPFIPAEQSSHFRRSGSFAVEVIPGRLVITSINTMYLSDSNDFVKDCRKSGRGDEEAHGGDAVLTFLEEVVLAPAKKKGLGVYIVGHVPPNPLNYFDECYDRYSKLVREYKDVILGSFFGHMNADHFFFPSPTTDFGKHNLPETSVASNLTASLEALRLTRPDFSSSLSTNTTLFPGWLDMYFHYLMMHYRAESNRDPDHLWQAALVAPSVVPMFQPALRVFKYAASTNENETGYSSKVGALQNYKQYYADLEKWNQRAIVAAAGGKRHRRLPAHGEYLYETEYKMKKEYGLQGLDGLGPHAWWDLAKRLGGKGKKHKKNMLRLRAQYLRNMVVGVKGIDIPLGKKVGEV